MSIYSPFLTYQRIFKSKADSRDWGKKYIYLLEKLHLEYINNPLEKEMAAHSILLAWRIPWTEEPGRPQPMRLQSRT